MLQTTHRFERANAQSLDTLPDESVDLVVTSPPYPMVAMWDDLFAQQDARIGNALAESNGQPAFEWMHQQLDLAWNEAYRVLKPGAIACINIGDATRKVNEAPFQLYCNHARIIQHCVEIGFQLLPSILWRKPTNSPTKYMGSGTLPAGAYVTLEHEWILIFRKGGKRAFNAADQARRRESAFFWSERNSWFSDCWNMTGAHQLMPATSNGRSRSAAYPFMIPFRLINMYSLIGDTVLDPFAGTGTTLWAAMACGRNSVGCDIEQGLASAFSSPAEPSRLIAYLNSVNQSRLEAQMAFSNREKSLKYEHTVLGFKVKTRQEKEIRLSQIQSMTPQANGWLVEHQELVSHGLKPESLKKIVNG
jgi:modification methylase